MLLLALLFVAASRSWLAACEQAQEERSKCVKAMETWVAEQHRLHPEEKQQDVHKMLYFLHIPRTAGRTTHNCFLLPMLPPSRRCARSYDGNAYNISMPDCGLLSSHDDYSAMREFPGFTAVYTSIRDPYTRVLSAYEFAVEIASRAAGKFVQNKEPSSKLGRVSTRNVWPWSYLAPFVEDDMMQRVRHCTSMRRALSIAHAQHGSTHAHANAAMRATQASSDGIAATQLLVNTLLCILHALSTASHHARRKEHTRASTHSATMKQSCMPLRMRTANAVVKGVSTAKHPGTSDCRQKAWWRSADLGAGSW